MSLGRLGPVDSGPLEFRLEGTTYTLTIPEDGLRVMQWAADGNWLALVPGALDPPSKNVLYALLGDPASPVGLRVCWRVVHGLATSVYGVEWWVAQRLAATVQEHWMTFAAWSVGVGFDPGSGGAAAHRVCAAVLAWLRSGAQDEKEARRLEQQIFAPPRPSRSSRGVRQRSQPGFSPREQADAFQKAFAELGGG